MALDDAAVLTAAKGYILEGAVDALKPTPQQIYDLDETTLPPGYTLVGHTSREDLPEFGNEGGTTETKGTWQNEALREVTTETAVDYVTYNLVEFNEKGLASYYGKVDGAVDGVLDVEDTPGTPIEKSILVVLVDKSYKVACHVSKASVRRDGPIGLSTDEFAQLPMRATFLKSTGKPLLSWIVGEDTP